MNIYLSPHHDDVCFSIGCLAASRGGELVNLFTVSSYQAELGAEAQAPAASVTEQRLEEDLRFAQAAGLTPHDFGLPDVPGNVDPFDLTGIDDEVEMLASRLIPYLLELLPEDSDPGSSALYCPMAIGGHRNHVSTFLTIHRAYTALSSRCAIYLYEDLHYASVEPLRDRDLPAAKAAFSGHGFLPMVVSLTPAEVENKLRWICFYKSQVGGSPMPSDLRSKYAPTNGLSSHPHEAIWRIFPRPAAKPIQTIAAGHGWSPDRRYQTAKLRVG